MTNLIDVSFSNEGEEVVSSSYVKNFAAITTTTFDDLISILIKTARIEIEKLSQLSIITKTVRAEWSCVNESISLPYPKIISIVSLESGTSILVEGINYKVKGLSNKTIYGNFTDGLVVNYTAGYGITVPEDLKMCIAKHVLENFEQRTGISVSQNYLLPNNWRKTALSYRPTWIMF
jgi:hypothetical protein